MEFYLLVSMQSDERGFEIFTNCKTVILMAKFYFACLKILENLIIKIHWSEDRMVVKTINI